MTGIPIIHENPPLIDEIDRVFHVRGKPVIFSWGNRIYLPMGGEVPAELMAHELVHCDRQGATEQQITDWWERYLIDPQFRLDEEVPAHWAEYQCLIEGGSRQIRRAALKQTAKRLAAPLYGRIVTPAKAKELILAAGKAQETANA